MANRESRKRKAITRDVSTSHGPGEDEESRNGATDANITLGDEAGRQNGTEEEDEDLAALTGSLTYEPFDSDDEINGEFSEGLDEDDNDNLSSTDEVEPEDDQDDDLTPNYTVTEDANGNPRYLYREIEPIYDSDDSDAQEATNTIGNIPLSFYDSYPHIGYDINGKKVMRPAKGEALDALLDSMEVPKGWTGLTDPATGKPLNLSYEELEMIKKIQGNELPEDGYDPYPDMVEYFSSKQEIMPLSAAPEPKRRFVKSKHEAKRIMKMVRAIREGRILPYKPPSEQVEEDPDVVRYDIWVDEAPMPDHPMNVPAPKLPPPGYDQSYNPPPEYLPTAAERKAWEELDDEDKDKEYLPVKHDALRKVPAYDQFVKERFERSLDLYLAPRVRRTKLNIDPESLLPKLPNPDELRPFPTMCGTIFKGHEGRVRSLAIDPTGVWLASGGDDGTVRVWELLTGRQIWRTHLAENEAVNAVRWRPGTDACILAAAAAESVYMMIPPIVDPETEAKSFELLDAGFGHAANGGTADSSSKSPATWSRPPAPLVASGVHLQLTMQHTIKVLSFHRRGDYLATVSPGASSRSIAIHTLSKHLSQLPFRRLKGLAQSVQFHPAKPILFVATQRIVRCYDLVRQELLKTLTPGARWISSFDVHPGGDNLIVGSYDRRLLWHDLDLSSRPYKTLRYHQKAIRQVQFHKGGLPLFADASDDGSVQVFHGKVVGDLMENATIVPLKVLRGHSVEKQLGVLDLDWHPREPWCVSAGADGTCRLWM